MASETRLWTVSRGDQTVSAVLRVLQRGVELRLDHSSGEKVGRMFATVKDGEAAAATRLQELERQGWVLVLT